MTKAWTYVVRTCFGCEDKAAYARIPWIGVHVATRQELCASCRGRIEVGRAAESAAGSTSLSA